VEGIDFWIWPSGSSIVSFLGLYAFNTFEELLYLRDEEDLNHIIEDLKINCVYPQSKVLPSLLL
jgi:hypothetical protein